MRADKQTNKQTDIHMLITIVTALHLVSEDISYVYRLDVFVRKLLHQLSAGEGCK